MAITEEIMQQALARIASLETELYNLKQASVAATSSSNNKKRSILDVKAFTRLETFKCAGWHTWSSKMRSLVGQAYPDCGRKLITNVELFKDPVDYKDLVEDIEIDMDRDSIITIAEDLFSALDFVLEGEAHDILQNTNGMEEGNGLEVWRRLKRRFDRQTRSKTMSDLGQVLNPDVAKTIGEVPKEIERWEEKVHRLKAKGDNNVTEDMMTAIVSRICPKRLRDYVDLHCNIDDAKSYVQIKDEILRVVESGILGKSGSTKEEDEKGHGQRPTPMECDNFENWPWAEEEDYYKYLNFFKGKGKGGGKGTKGGYSYEYPGNYGFKGGFKGYGDKGKGKGGFFKGKGYKGGYKGGGDEKGKGKGGGKPSFTTEFQGHCSYCGEWGHTQRYCPVRDSHWNGKGANNLENETYGQEECPGHHEHHEKEEQPGGYGDLGGLGFCTGTARLPQSTVNPTVVKNSFHQLQAIDEEEDYSELFHLPGEKVQNMVKIEVVADSGAADCVLPTHLLPEVPVQPGQEVNYKAPGGKIITSRGSKTVLGKAGGCRKKMEFQVADVNKPLASLRKIVKKGHRVVLDDEEQGGGYIMHKESGEKIQLRVQNEVYMFDFWVDLPASAAAGF